jgi:hypothetical protein
MADAALVFVATKALVAKAPEESALPALKPNQPYQSNPEPSKINGMLWGAEI